MTDTKHTPPRDDAGGRKEHRAGRNDTKIIPTAAAMPLMVATRKKRKQSSYAVFDVTGGHLADFRRHMEARELNPQHVAQVLSHCARLIDARRLTFPSDIDASEIEAYVASLRESGASARTANAALAAFKTFCGWLKKQGRMTGNPAARVGKLNEKADRRQFLKLMDYIREHRPPAVVVWKLDRLARNSLDSQLFRAKLKEYGTRLISATEAIPDDYSGKLFADIISAIAEYDNSLRAERSRNGMVWRAQEGYWVNSPPLGYQAARTPDNKPTLEPDEKAPMVLELFRLVADGHSQADARAVVTANGLRSRTGKPLTKQAVSNMLSNAAYAGIMNGKLVPVPIPGKWPAIVPQDIFDAVQVRLRRGTQTRRDSDDFPLRGLLACPKCEGLLTASYSKGNGGSYAYYHCHGCNGVRVRREEAEEAVTGLIDGLAVEEGMLDFMETVIVRYMQDRFQPAKQEKEKYRRKLIGLEERMDRLVELRLAGKIELKRYEEKYADLEERLLHARHDYNVADKEKIDLLEEFKQARCLLTQPGRYWRTANTRERHSVFPLLFDKPLTVKTDKKIGTLRLEGSNCLIWLPIMYRFPTDVKQIFPWLEAHHSFRLAREAA